MSLTLESRRCSYCLDAVMADDEAWTCDECGERLHRDCSDLNQGCSNYGCAGCAATPPLETPLPPVTWIGEAPVGLVAGGNRKAEELAVESDGPDVRPEEAPVKQLPPPTAPDPSWSSADELIVPVTVAPPPAPPVPLAPTDLGPAQVVEPSPAAHTGIVWAQAPAPSRAPWPAPASSLSDVADREETMRPVESLAPAPLASDERAAAHEPTAGTRSASPVRQFCDQCGTTVGGTDRFCGTCGSKLELLT